MMVLLVGLLTIPLFGQAAPADPGLPPSMKVYQMVFLMSGSTPLPEGPRAEAMQKEHLARMADMNEHRINLLYGPFADEGDLRGILILDVKDADEARARMADDPFVKGGMMSVNVRPWLGPKTGFGEPPERDAMKPGALEQFYFGFLVRGPNRAQPEAEAEELQKGHLAYMADLSKQGRLVMAGPFMDDGDARGIVIYRVATIEEAKALAAGDPAVKAGRLRIEARPWMTLKGILE